MTVVRSDAPGAEGWKWPFNARRTHYYRDSRSLCGKHSLTEPEMLGQTNPMIEQFGEERDPSICRTCFQLAKGESR